MWRVEVKPTIISWRFSLQLVMSFFKTIICYLNDIIFRWWSYTHNNDQNLCIVYIIFVDQICKPWNLVSWNGLVFCLSSDGCITKYLTLRGLVQPHPTWWACVWPFRIHYLWRVCGFLTQKCRSWWHVWDKLCGFMHYNVQHVVFNVAYITLTLRLA
jgi:hypothetical protein